MKIQYKLIAILTTFFSVLTFGGNALNVNALEGTASLKGFTVEDGWTYVSDYDYVWQDFYEGSTYFGATKMWVGRYTLYDAASDTMFYLIMSKASITPNNINATFYNEKMAVLYTSNSTSLFVEMYDPVTANSTYSYDFGFSFSAQGPVVDYTATSTSTEIGISNVETDHSLSTSFNFKRYYKWLPDNEIYHGTISGNSFVIFQLDDYSVACASHLNFQISVNYVGWVYHRYFIGGLESFHSITYPFYFSL